MSRWPYEPLDRLLGGTVGTQAEHLGTTRRNILRWRADGLSRKTAERLADTVRSHVYELWPSMVDLDAAEAEEAEEQRKARRREYRRRYYLANRERELERQRARDEADAEIKRRYARWYYQANRERVLVEQRRRDRERTERRRLLRQLEQEQVPAPDRHLHDDRKAS